MEPQMNADERRCKWWKERGNRRGSRERPAAIVNHQSQIINLCGDLGRRRDESSPAGETSQSKVGAAEGITGPRGQRVTRLARQPGG
jgi:hypothetical protein